MHRKLKIANRYKGLTLTEVLIASALLIIAVVPILKALTIAQVTDTKIDRRARSLMLAQAKLADIKAQSQLSFPAQGALTEAGTVLDGSYLCNVTDVKPPGWSNFLKIDVEVGYDVNGNGTLAADEVEVHLATNITKIHQFP